MNPNQSPSKKINFPNPLYKCRVRKKKIYKGKMAPEQHLFIVVDAIKGKNVCQIAVLCRGGMNKKQETDVINDIISLLESKYNIQIDRNETNRIK